MTNFGVINIIGISFKKNRWFMVYRYYRYPYNSNNKHTIFLSLHFLLLHFNIIYVMRKIVCNSGQQLCIALREIIYL